MNQLAENKPSRYLLFIIALFLALRVAMLLFSSFNLFRWEEMYVGTIAKDLLDGASLPVLDYRNNYAQGPDALQGGMAAFLFLIFGEKIWVLKLIPLATNLLALIIYWLFLKEFFGKTVAVFACSLFALSPPLFTVRSLVMADLHFELILFELMLWWLFCKIIRSYLTAHPVSPLLYALAGFGCGFSLYFDFEAIIVIGACLFSWFLMDKKFFLKKGFIFFIASFLAGCLPLWAYYLYHGNISETEECSLLLLSAPGEIFHKGTSYLLNDLPKSLFFQLGNFITAAYILVFVLSFIAATYSFFCAYRSRKELNNRIFLLPILIYLLFFIGGYSIIYAASAPIGTPESYLPYKHYKHVIHIYPALFIVAAVFLEHIFKRRNRAGILLCGALLSINVIGNMKTMSLSNLQDREFLFNKPYNFALMGYQAVAKHKHNIKKAMELIGNFKGDRRDECLSGLGAAVARDTFVTKDYHLSLFDIMEDLKGEDRRDFVRGMGFFIVDHIGEGANLNDMKEYHRVMLSHIGDEYKTEYFKGMCFYFSIAGYQPDFWDKFHFFIENFSHARMREKTACYEGVGESLVRVYGCGTASGHAAIEKLKKRQHKFDPDFFRSLDTGMQQGCGIS